MDGIPCELWKTLLDQHTAETESEKPTTDISKIMTLVFNDIEEHGIVEGTNFSLG
jgi:hypothetical protein